MDQSMDDLDRHLEADGPDLDSADPVVAKGPKGEDVLGLLKNDFDAFYKRFKPLIVRIAKSRGATPSNAEDIAQGVLLELYQKRKQLPFMTKAFIEQMARHRTQDHRGRSVNRHEITFGDRMPGDDDDRDPLQLLMEKHGTVATGQVEAADNVIDLKSVRNQLGDLFEKLSPRQKDVIRRTYFEGQSDQAIANAWNTDIRSVTSNRHLAMRRLREMAAGPQRKILRELFEAVSHEPIGPDEAEAA